MSKALSATPLLAIAVAGEVEGGESIRATARIVSASDTRAEATSAFCAYPEAISALKKIPWSHKLSATPGYRCSCSRYRANDSRIGDFTRVRIIERCDYGGARSYGTGDESGDDAIDEVH